MTPPPKITILTDGNELKFKETLKPIGSKSLFYIYEYTKSKTKKGTHLGLTEIELEALIKNNIKRKK